MIALHPLGTVATLAAVVVGVLLIFLSERAGRKSDRPQAPPLPPSAWGQAPPERSREGGYDDRDVWAALREQDRALKAQNDRLEAVESSLWRVERDRS